MLRSLLKSQLILVLSISSLVEAAGAAIEQDPTAYANALIGKTASGSLKGSLKQKWDQASGHLLVPSARKAILDFSAKHLTEAHQRSAVVFYPFGGPDAIYPHLFFPWVEKLFLVGIEDVGTIGEITTNTYAEVRDIMALLFRDSFYHTKVMRKDQQTSLANATLTKVLASLALLNARLYGYEYLEWNLEGLLVPWQGQGKAPAMRVRYSFEADRVVREVYYFQQNLSNSPYSGMASLFDGKSLQSRGLINFLLRHRGMTSFYKAASFLSHHDYFSKINDFVLENSNFIVQSDTGIPYRLIKSSEIFDIKLFGRYAYPRSPFVGRYHQIDLKDDMNSVRHVDLGTANGSLPFGFCYNKSTSPLIYARRLVPIAQVVRE